ncbi:MAG: carboxypeptidase regulatory-like domain-containing protein [Flavobacteriales bacterium]|nr:carboxypeptidase regulatory-like domain-containing protein [Flavobacteriales bacterium]
MKTQRPIFLVLLALLALPAVHGQKLKQRMADKYADVFDYPRMTAVYEDMASRGKADRNILRRLAKGYVRMGELAKAERTYATLATDSLASSDDIWYYAEVLRANGKYNEAVVQYQRLKQKSPDDVRPWPYADKPEVFDRFVRDSTRNTVRSLPINSAQADVGPAVMNDLLLFSSARGEGVGGKHSYKWDGQPFLNLYSALLKGEHAEDPRVMRKDVNSRYHDGTVAYDEGSKRLYVTRNNLHYSVLTKAANGNLNLGIYTSDIVMGAYGQQEWGALVPFEHNDPEYNYGHPCVSRGGMRLFFVSDRPGGLGGTDIWFCERIGNQWGVPQNMGPRVNSTGNEMYPFLAGDSTLYFTSNGHPGLGGMDVFWCRLTPNGPGNVFNMGYPVNTNRNDHGLMLLADDSTGFFVSDRPGGVGSDDIYGVTVRPPMMHLAGIVVDKESQRPLDGANIVLKDAENRAIDRFTFESIPGGRFRIEVPYREMYALVATRNGYMQREMSVATDVDPLEEIVVELSRYDYGADGVVSNGATGQPLAGAIVRLLDASEKELETFTTGDDGHYSFTLQPETDYRLRVEREGFFKQSARISTKGRTSTIIKTDFNLFPLEVGQIVRLENIYYDYNKWNIRPDAALELDKLVATLRDNPTVRIELGSHTDCRGKDAYNLSLSEKRAKSAVDYIISQGIPKERITSKGYGETVPFVECECTKCTEDQHQQNRRTEFKVLSK